MTKNIVLVHGINDNGAGFGALPQTLQSAGYRVLTPSLTPNNGKVSIEVLAEQLAGRVNAHFGLLARIHVVGFSMGGLVSRYYVQELGGHRRTVSLTAIAAPHYGTVWAYLNNRPAVRQMRPGSDLLSRLAASEHKLDNIDVHAYWTPYDTTVIPPRNCVWPRASNMSVPAPLHSLMGNQAHVREHLLQRLDALT